MLVIFKAAVAVPFELNAGEAGLIEQVAPVGQPDKTVNCTPVVEKEFIDCKFTL